ncbi:MAG TPA: leucine-rich repeat domain-containing protein [Candidatus Dependentiae bacterium]|nr:leucine-rich repeat domain-containing protein [Candidatus Dependentiae bacterium]HRQ62636.1 leucine-rich repeat domain-containing protein [Candidatus Dependentiae bacterium]
MKKLLVIVLTCAGIGALSAMQKEVTQVTLVGKDGQQVIIDRSVAQRIPTIQDLLEVFPAGQEIPIENFDAATLQSVVDFVEQVYTQAPVLKLDPKFFEKTEMHQAYTPADIPEQVRIIKMIYGYGDKGSNQAFMQAADFLGLDWVEVALQGGVSIADLIVFNQMPKIIYKILDCSKETIKRTITSIAGISLLPKDSFANLQQLNLSGNQITTIPDAIGNLANLKALNLNNNQIPTIPDAIGNLTNLESLYLPGNQITIIPDAIGNLTNLQWFDLSGNQITTIPDAIGNLTNLKALNLNNNQIPTIPDAIGNLANLKALYLSGNQVTTIPDAIGNLANLQRLNLSGNQITTIPDAIGNLTNLRILLLKDNQLDQATKDRVRQLLPNAEIEF